MVRPLRLACVLSFVCLLDAQSRVSILRGEVRGSFPADAQVELTPCSGGAPPESSGVSANGMFEVRNLSAGCYKVAVVSQTTGRRLHESLMDLGPGTGSVELRTRETPASARPLSGLVNAKKLRTPAPKKASKAFRDAVRASEEGDRERAVVKLQEAIRHHPDFFEAHANLGTQYARLGRQQEALVEFEEARRLDDSSAIIWTNCAASYLDFKRLADAEAALREAIRRDPAYPQAHYLLAHVATIKRDYAEARRQLSMAADQLPAAKQALERLDARSKALAR